MWIAKNSLTGQTYGKSFSSIYDCQSYIDKELKILEYLCQRVQIIEDSIKDEEEYEKWYKEKYGDNSSIVATIFSRIEFAFQDFFKSLNSSSPDVSTNSYSKNHIIRCWYVEQERFADGFDF